MNWNKTIHRSRRKALKPARRRVAYAQLPKGCRELIDYLRRWLAQNIAANGLPFDVVLKSVIALHEAGHLTLVTDGDHVGLVPCVDGEPLPGGYDFETAHRNAGGQS